MNVRLLTETGNHKPLVVGSNPTASTIDIKAFSMGEGVLLA